MTDPPWTMHDEIERIRGVADLLCSGHADLRDRFSRQALLLDLSVLALSTWLVTLAFVEPRINVSLTPFGIDAQIWTGLLAVCTFFLSILQLKVDWKGRSDAHRRTYDTFAEVKREAGYLLASGDPLEEQACRRVLARYDMASAVGVPIPEGEFLRQKQRHRMKIALSRHLDQHPFASLWLVGIKCWLQDNLGGKASNAAKP